MSTISDKLFLRSTGSIVDAMLKFNFLVYCGSRTRLLWVDMMLFVPAANHSGAIRRQRITRRGATAKSHGNDKTE